MTRVCTSPTSAKRISSMAGVAALACMLCSSPRAQFAAAVTPPRFEVSVEPGQVTRQVMEITHAIAGTGTYRVYTTDWNMDASGALTFFDKIQPGSCRPWVSIERREISVTQGTRVRYRFEVAPPLGVTAQECRFALMIEKAPETAPEVKGTNIQFPVQGRIGVIVYVAVGDVAPKIELRGVSAENLQGRKVPVATLANSGTAHGRADGVIEGVDAKGVKIEFVVSNFPVLAGDTRPIALWPQDGADGKPVNIAWPVRLKGLLEWTGGQQAIDVSLP